MIPASHLLAFAAAAFVIIVIPGPSVLFAVGRALALGRRAALITVVANALGTMVPLAAVAVGLGAVLAASAIAMTVVKLVGAGYLVFLGVQAIRERRSLAAALAPDDVAVADPSSRRVFRQGFVVGATNPKAIVFFAAILPQFTHAGSGPLPLQIALLGVVFLLIAVASDGAWALAAGTARDWFARSPRRLSTLGGVGGVMIIGVGASVAVTGSHS